MEKGDAKQLGALGFCAFSVPAILLLPQTGWESVLLAVAGCILVVTFGRPVTGRDCKALSVVLLLWNILLMGKLAREISLLYGTDTPLPGLLLLLLSAYCGKKGAGPVVGSVLSFFLIGIYGVLFVFAVPDMDLGRLMPERETELLNLPYGFFPLLILYMYRGGRKTGAMWAAIGGALAVGAALITEGLGAPDFYTASQSVNLFGTMERLEPFVASAVTAGGFCILTTLIRVNEGLWEGLRKEKKNYPIELFLLPSLALCILASRIPHRIWALGTTLCWGLIPILTQVIVPKEKAQKFLKK